VCVVPAGIVKSFLTNWSNPMSIPTLAFFVPFQTCIVLGTLTEVTIRYLVSYFSDLPSWNRPATGQGKVFWHWWFRKSDIHYLAASYNEQADVKVLLHLFRHSPDISVYTAITCLQCVLLLTLSSPTETTLRFITP